MEAIDRAVRRIQMMLGRGRVMLVDDSGPVQKIQVRSNKHEVADDRLRVTEFGFSSNPPVGSDVLTSHISGDRTDGAVYATNHQESRPRGMAPGESMLYSEDGKQIYLTASGGIVVEAKGQDVTVNNATTVTINASTEILMNTPLLKVTGDILDNSGTNTKTIAQMRTVYDGHHHGGVTPGAGSSSTPDSTM